MSLLADRTEKIRTMIIMLLWRIWSVRNDRLHHKDTPPLDITKDFLCSYLSSFNQAQKYSIEDIVKGKMTMDEHVVIPAPISAKRAPWPKPPLVWVALSTDGSFVKEIGLLGLTWCLGIRGEVIFSAYRYLYNCMPMKYRLVYSWDCLFYIRMKFNSLSFIFFSKLKDDKCHMSRVLYSPILSAHQTINGSTP